MYIMCLPLVGLCALSLHLERGSASNSFMLITISTQSPPFQCCPRSCQLLCSTTEPSQQNIHSPASVLCISKCANLQVTPSSITYLVLVGFITVEGAVAVALGSDGATAVSKVPQPLGDAVGPTVLPFRVILATTEIDLAAVLRLLDQVLAFFETFASESGVSEQEDGEDGRAAHLVVVLMRFGRVACVEWPQSQC